MTNAPTPKTKPTCNPAAFWRAVDDWAAASHLTDHEAAQQLGLTVEEYARRHDSRRQPAPAVVLALFAYVPQLTADTIGLQPHSRDTKPLAEGERNAVRDLVAKLAGQYGRKSLALRLHVTESHISRLISHQRQPGARILTALIAREPQAAAELFSAHHKPDRDAPCHRQK